MFSPDCNRFYGWMTYYDEKNCGSHVFFVDTSSNSFRFNTFEFLHRRG